MASYSVPYIYILLLFAFANSSDLPIDDYMTEVEHKDTVYSPLVGSNYWSRTWRLLFISIVFFLGSIINAFFMAVFFIKPYFRPVGYIFLSSSGLCDLLITAILPVNFVILLSGQGDTIVTCKIEQFVVQTSTYCYNIYSALTALEFYRRIGPSRRRNHIFHSVSATHIEVLAMFISATLSGLGAFYDMDYDYCERKHQGNSMFRTMTSTVIIILPAILTISCSVIVLLVSYHRTLKYPLYRRTPRYRIENSVCEAFIINYFLYLLAWLPFYLIVNISPEITNDVFYPFAFIGTLRSSLSGFLYGALNSILGGAYCDIIDYCCYKNNQPNLYRTQSRDVELVEAPSGKVRIYTLQNAEAPVAQPCCTCKTSEL